MIIDIEGDGLSKVYNRQVFKEWPYFDSETRIWCITFANKRRTLTYACKLPEEPRKLPHTYVKNGNICDTTIAVHEKDSVMPAQLTIRSKGRTIKEFVDYKEFLQAIADHLTECKVIHFKGFAEGDKHHPYDAALLKANFDKYGIKYEPCLFGRMRAVFIVNGWKHTAPQAKAGEWIDNQEYLYNAVKHNIEDAIQLADIIYGKEKFCRYTVDKISENS